MSDVVVTLSGIFSVEELEGKNVDQIISLALGVYNIPRESVDKPFVTIHNKTLNRYTPFQGDEVIGKIDPKKDVLRVILPLKTVSVELNAEKKYLVEG